MREGKASSGGHVPRSVRGDKTTCLSSFHSTVAGEPSGHTNKQEIIKGPDVSRKPFPERRLGWGRAGGLSVLLVWAGVPRVPVFLQFTLFYKQAFVSPPQNGQVPATSGL